MNFKKNLYSFLCIIALANEFKETLMIFFELILCFHLLHLQRYDFEYSWRKHWKKYQKIKQEKILNKSQRQNQEDETLAEIVKK